MSNFGPHAWVGNALTTEDVRRKCAALHNHCEGIGRPYGAILRSYYAFALLAKTRAALQTKLETIPQASRESRGIFLFAGTPDDLTDHYRSLIDAGIQYFVVIPERGDAETIELLGEHVLPALA
jgi:alkanesulfonate monooxygenase SsuD/methylene tetrahydromethanopterin reductase-like flavin-dependent oxidoreductase (luciferase family)